MKKILYIDPQSIENMALYDYKLLEGIEARILYCCNMQYNASILDKVIYYKIFKYNRFKSPILKGISYIISLLQISFLAIRERPDIVHIQWWRLWFIDYLFLSILKKNAGMTVFTVHNIVPHESGNLMKNKCMKYYMKVDRLIVHTEVTKNELITEFSIPENKIYVIPHGVLQFNVNKLDLDEFKRKFIAKYDLSSRIVFTTLGNQSYYKGTDIIKGAFMESGILKNNDKVFLIIAGRGDIINKDFAKKYSNVYVNNEVLSSLEFQALMQLSDVLLLPYRMISQSGVLLTAIENHIPYIATDVGGLTEPFSIANVGWKLPSSNVDELRKLMEDIITKEREIIAIKNDMLAWNKVKANYSWDKISVLTMNCYGFK